MYMYDEMVILTREQNLEKILKELNAKDENIKFTMKIENKNKLKFLDAKITKDDNKIQTKVYRKP